MGMADLIKVSIQGQMPGGEVWSINPVYRMNVQGQAVTVTQLQAIVTAVNAIAVPTTLRAVFNTSTTITGCRVEARSNTGVLQALAEGTRATATSGTGGNDHPYQNALVVSLRSPLAGASGRGRLYLPATGIPIINTTLRPSSTIVGQSLTGAKQYLQAIQTAVTGQVTDCILAVWSRKLSTTLGVTRIQMGDVLDTQRRRRDAVIENISELSYP
jgi:hypothetical protein